MKLTDKRLIDFLEKKAKEQNFDTKKFLNPSADDLRDVFLLHGMREASEKINQAIKDNKKILVYGDYDADGICSSTILYLFFKSLGADVSVYIPNRFDNGYGISVEAIEEIENEFNPDLIVTVDLGITAVEEIEILKQEGIDVVVTDHHIPLSEVPDTIIVDPKFKSEAYGFDALCGAGVALKFVEAMSDKQTALSFVDICALATIGDIVPLVDENRVLAKLGLEKINSGNTLESIKFLKNKLGIEKLNSTDVSFKIVPRLNACGRMDNALKVFDFLIETNQKLLEQKYAEIEGDNTIRLGFIEKGNKIIDKYLEKTDVSSPSLLIVGDFHEGIVGILASRICHEFNKPAIIFTKTEDGTLKGSGRSIPSVDIHKILSTMTDYFVNFGGHKMAVGLEIMPEVFEDFKTAFNQKIAEQTTPDDFLIDSSNYDIEIFDKDLSLEFLEELNILEPFGCDNEKPVLMIEEQKMNVVPVSEKAFKHYKLFTSTNQPLISFSFYKQNQVCSSNSKKQFIIELAENNYKNKKSLSTTVKKMNIVSADLDGKDEMAFLTSLYNKYYSIFDFNDPKKYHITADIKKVVKDKLLVSQYGTIVVATSSSDAKIVEELSLQKYYSAVPYKNGQNTVLVSPSGIITPADLTGYKNIIFLHKYFDEEHLFLSQKFDVFEPEEISVSNFKISKERDTLVGVYKLALNFASLKANDIIDFATKLSIKSPNLSASQILFGLIVFLELNFFEWDETLSNLVVLKSKKVELSASKFLNEVNLWIVN